MKVTYHQFMKRREVLFSPAVTLATQACVDFHKEAQGLRMYINLMVTEPSSMEEYYEVFLITDQPELVKRVNKTAGMWLRESDKVPGMDINSEFMVTEEPPTKEELDNAKKFNEGLKALLKNNPKK